MRQLMLYGSCVSRDTIEHTKDVRVAAYIARQSLISAASAPTPFPDDVNIESKFQKRMVRDDFTSSAFATIRQLKSDVDGLVWDLIDERLGVTALGDNRFVTRSLEYRASELPRILGEERILRFGDDEHFELWRRAAGQFLELLDEVDFIERTMVIEAPFADHDDAGLAAPRFEGISADVWNTNYTRYYDVLRDAGLSLHSITAEESVTTPDHRWGPAAYHYTPPAYERAAAAILGQLVTQPPRPERSTRRDVTRYRFPRMQHSDIPSFLASRVELGIHSIDYNDSPLDILVQPQPGADTMIVSFHAAMSRGVSTPVFVGVGVSSDTGAHRVFLSDPSLDLDASLMLAWHTGNSRQPLQDDLPRLLEHIRVDLGAEHIIFYGPSGGGFAAMYYSAQFPGSLAIPTNPQTIIGNYTAEVVSKYAAVCWGASSGEVEEVLQARVAADLREVYRVWPGNTVAYMQNRTDVHLERHLAPFMAAVPTNAQFHVHLGEWGNGHVAPPKELMSEILTAAANSSGDWSTAVTRLGFCPVIRQGFEGSDTRGETASDT